MNNCFSTPLSCIAALLFCLGASPAFAAQSYAEERAQIEELLARYMFAMDFADDATFASLFTKTGILDVGSGELIGREAIQQSVAKRAIIMEKREAENTPGIRPVAHRHLLTNIAIEINGNRARGRSYWSHVSNSSADRGAVLVSYGHYEDEFIKEDGEWLFSYRKMYNEQNAKLHAQKGNPAW